MLKSALVLPSRLLDGASVGLGHGLVCQREAAFAILCKDPRAVEIDHLPQESALALDLLLGLAPRLRSPASCIARRTTGAEPAEPVLQHVVGRPAPHGIHRAVLADGPGHEDERNISDFARVISSAARPSNAVGMLKSDRTRSGRIRRARAGSRARGRRKRGEPEPARRSSRWQSSASAGASSTIRTLSSRSSMQRPSRAYGVGVRLIASQ
jgi:hypothetical protein